MTALSKLAAKLKKKYANEHLYDRSSFDEERSMEDYEKALKDFEDDYLYEATDDELVKLEKDIKHQIQRIMIHRQEEAEQFERTPDLSIPKFLEAKLKLINMAIYKNHQKRNPRDFIRGH